MFCDIYSMMIWGAPDQGQGIFFYIFTPSREGIIFLKMNSVFFVHQAGEELFSQDEFRILCTPSKGGIIFLKMNSVFFVLTKK